MARQNVGMRQVGRWIALILGPDGPYLRLALLYGAAISLLSLATPISVQLLINAVANIAMPAPLFTLSAILFTLLLLAGLLSALRVQIMALFERRFFARMIAEITLRAVHARNPFFHDARRGDLFNRFFDMATVQKALTSLLVGGFAIVLQGVVGLVVTSFYHPFFLAFNVVLVTLIALILMVWARSAFTTAIAVSHSKHTAAHWLHGVGGSNGFYKSSRHMHFAIDRSEALTADYVAKHRAHFRYTFTQTICLLLLYACASAGLLTMGGLLIIAGELSIGQLVAAELILSGVFYGIAQLGSYLDVFYDLVGGLEELSLFWDVPQESPPKPDAPALPDGAIAFRDVEYGDYHLNFSVGSGEQLAILAAPGVDRAVSVLLKRLDTPARGLVTVGGADIGTYDMLRLRSDVVVLDRPTIVDLSLRDYLLLASGDRHDAMIAALDLVGLADRVGQLPQGMDTMLSPLGWPLAVGETMALKLAGALLARPKVLVLSALYDLLPPHRLDKVLGNLRQTGTSVLQFTGRPEGLQRDGWLWLGNREQIRAGQLDDIRLVAGFSAEVRA
ncbi:ABC transporter transmembrane domain-containing protein [Novosphingobium sp.]|uniref:ABC transporter transmembrane domain-containing protein n=1 Tax=Novosphingobium sp. TaxID=1874826 RepID=UPI0038BBF70F